MSWVILRPTMIYGDGRDSNVSALVRFVRRYGFLPLLGPARGLRQPVHVADVAQACVAALTACAAVNRDYTLSGGETLTYRQLCERVFRSLERPPRLVRVPIALFRLARPLSYLLPARLRWLTAMVERMNDDLAYDHSDARRDLGFNPRSFRLAGKDLQSQSTRILP